ncbi:Uridine phosphorylase [Anaerosporobacter mobilis DSM 15930]|uniref:Uridine phosphorylase n=1 Tax=Anaerosporobacter mobilis DSM 15930 TaxID=1120996 RepID=A0A1M7KNV4_9FIRM|nr:nucleoside phosphorylase [Anaerosporobacter mobilis]SHM67173.1 Uridine phosphorylase [Anaerosporobacter mobilis DSM 15930]
MILEEFDCNKKAIVDVYDLVKPIESFPKIAVSCFSRVTFERLVNELNGKVIAKSNLANMEIPIFKAIYNGVEVALFMSYVGAAGCVAVIEEVFAMGADKLILFGTCGVLDASIEDCSIIIPNKAVRDEGTSFHYAKPSDEIEVNKKYIDEFVDILKEFECHYTIGKVWTTDGIYRETRGKVNSRKQAGCLCVDMECSAVAALAEFREKEVFQFFYAADNLDNETWDARSLGNESNVLEKDRIAMLAMELAKKL